MQVDSPGLEWDEGGIELGHRTLAPSPGPAQLSDTSDADILQQIEQFENSIFRQDLDTGEMRCYQHNTRRVARRDQMTSILGHLEEDHKQLQVGTVNMALWYTIEVNQLVLIVSLFMVLI